MKRHRGLDFTNSDYALARLEGTRNTRNRHYRNAQAILAGERITPQWIYDHTIKKKEKITPLLEKTKNHQTQHFKKLNSKYDRIDKQRKDAIKRYEETLKKIHGEIDKKQKAVSALQQKLEQEKSQLQQLITESETKKEKAHEQYTQETIRIGKLLEDITKHKSRVLNPGPHHLLYGDSEKAKSKRNKMALSLAKLMYYDPQIKYHQKARNYLIDHNMFGKIPLQDRSEQYKVGAKSKFKTRDEHGRFQLPVNIRNANGKLKTFKQVTKELMNLRKKNSASKKNSSMKSTKSTKSTSSMDL